MIAIAAAGLALLVSCVCDLRRFEIPVLLSQLLEKFTSRPGDSFVSGPRELFEPLAGGDPNNDWIDTVGAAREGRDTACAVGEMLTAGEYDVLEARQPPSPTDLVDDVSRGTCRTYSVVVRCEGDECIGRFHISIDFGFGPNAPLKFGSSATIKAR